MPDWNHLLGWLDRGQFVPLYVHSRLFMSTRGRPELGELRLQVHAFQLARPNYVEGSLKCFVFLHFSSPLVSSRSELEASMGGAPPQGEAELPGACCVSGGDAARGSRLGA